MMSPNPVVTWPVKHSRWKPTTMSGDILELSRAYLSGGPADDLGEPQDPGLGRKDRAPRLERAADGSIVLANNDVHNPVHVAVIGSARLNAQAHQSYYAVKAAAEMTLGPKDSRRYTLEPGNTYLIAVGPPPPRLQGDPHYVVSVSIPIDTPNAVPLDTIPTQTTTGLEPQDEVQRLDKVRLYLGAKTDYRLALAYEAYQFILGKPAAARVRDQDVKSHLDSNMSDVRKAVNKILYEGMETYHYLRAEGMLELLVTHNVLTRRDVQLASAKRRKRNPQLAPLIDE